MADYDDMERPVEDENEPLQLVFGVTLQQIIDVVMNLSRFCTVMKFGESHIGKKKFHWSLFLDRPKKSLLKNEIDYGLYCEIEMAEQ